MEKKAVSRIMLELLLVGISALMFNVQSVETSGPIYIRADGSIDPPTAPIQRDGDLYTLTGSITDVAEGIFIQRDNMTLNGAGYTIQGLEWGADIGIYLLDRNNVTIKNANINKFTSGIAVYNVSRPADFNRIVGNNLTDNLMEGIAISGPSNNYILGNNVTGNIVESTPEGIAISGSSNNTIVGNFITNNGDGIALVGSSNNTICENDIEANVNDGVYISWVSDTSIFRNNIKTSSYCGICLGGASRNTIYENNIEANSYGIWLEVGSSDNSIYHNNFIDNNVQVSFGLEMDGVNNNWYDRYPSGGNYWSDYMGVDFYSGPGPGPYRRWEGSDGIGDTPYIIDDNNWDRYPLMARVLETRIPGDINGDGKTDISDLFLMAQNYGKTDP